MSGVIWNRKLIATVAAIILAAIFLLLSGCTSKSASSLPVAHEGQIDLASWSPSRDGLVPLNGQWSFEWTDVKGAVSKGRYIPMPGTWGNMVLNGTRLSDQGRGIYRLEIVNLPIRSMVAIRVPNLSTSYTFFVDGKRILSHGTPGISKETTVPYQLPETIFFTPTRDTTVIELQVANFHHRNGGVRLPLVLGTAGQIKSLMFKQEAQELVVLGCLLMIGIYHLGLYVLRRKDLANLYFAFLCLAVAGRMSVIGIDFLMHMFPQLTWTASGRLEYSFFVLSGLSGFAYFRRMYPREMNIRWSFAASAVAGALVLCTWLVPMLQVSQLIIVYQSYLLMLCIGALILLIRAWLRRREGAKLALVGVAGLVATVLNDMLLYHGWWQSTDMVPFGLLFLITMNSFIISMRFSRTFSKAERLSAELKEWNNLLEERISERTDEVLRMEQSRRQLVSNISHDLRTPMTLIQGYLEALRDGVIRDPEQREATIRAMLTKVEGLNGLIQDLFELSLLEARRAQMAYGVVDLTLWMRRIEEEYEAELREKGIAFGREGSIEEGMLAEVRVDEHRMDRVFANLLYNAARHTPQGGSITIRYGIGASGNEAEIAIEDTGTGIHPQDLPHIFERFYKNDKSRHSSSGGSGLGLSIAREIVETHGGRLTAANRPEGGSEFRIVLPLYNGEAPHSVN